jgi:serine/threonine-protein kinase
LPRTGPYKTTPADANGEQPRTIKEDVVVLAPQPVLGTIGSYELIEKITRGGMGIIYKARHTTLNRIDALKTMRGDASLDAERAERFDREMLAAAHLNHPNIIPIYDAATHLGQPYYTMPFIAGGSLDDHLPRFTSDPRAAVALVEKVARAIHHAHEKGIVHRDLKPGNVLLDGDEPKVSDFGLAKVVDSGGELTRSGAVLGTVPYMAPEQAAGSTKLIGPKTDVWALGVILYELLTGQRPFPGSTPEEIQKKILRAEPALPRSLHRGLDRALEGIVLKCLEKAPSERYPTARALADQLGCWLAGQRIPFRLADLGRQFRRVQRRHPSWSIAAGLAALVIVVLAVASQWTDPDRALKDIQARLVNKERVVLVPATGAPAHFRMGLGETNYLIKNKKSEPFTFTTTEEQACLIELLPDPMQDKYRFHAKVQHGDSMPRSEVGLYFAHSKHLTQRGTEHFFCALTFNDREDIYRLPPLNKEPCTALILNLWRCCPEAHAYHSTKFRFLKHFPSAVSAKPFLAIDRDLEVEATANSYRLRWNGALVGEVGYAELAAEAKELRHSWLERGKPDGFCPDASPRGALGLFVAHGAAYFQEGVIEPP